MNGIGGDSVAGWLTPELSLFLKGHLRALWRRWSGEGWRFWRTGLARELLATTRRRRLPDWLTPESKEMARAFHFDRPRIPLKALTSPRSFRAFAIADPSWEASLERFERLSHRTGIRIAAPWCDFGLASFVMSLEGCALEETPPAKGLLRTAMAGALPPEVRHSAIEKRSSSKLRASGLFGHARHQVEHLLSKSRLADAGLIDQAKILTHYRKHATLKTEVPRLWEVLTAESWLQVFPAV
jgi:hypothetical protein